jgi:galactokinase
MIKQIRSQSRHTQDFIDRRFYRRKDNAEQALAEFAETARSETNLEALTGKLVDMVSQTMQPEQVSVWLKYPYERKLRTKR